MVLQSGQKQVTTSSCTVPLRKSGANTQTFRENLESLNQRRVFVKVGVVIFSTRLPRLPLSSQLLNSLAFFEVSLSIKE